MAYTFGKQPLRVAAPNDAYLSFVSRYLPEALNQTFVMNSPVYMVAGYLTEVATPFTSADVSCGLALDDAHNGAAGAHEIRVAPWSDNLGVYGNFLGAAAADNVLAAADLFGTFQLTYSATLVNGDPGWYIEDDAGQASVTITSFTSDMVPVNVVPSKAAAGDTNARVTATIQAAYIQELL